MLLFVLYKLIRHVQCQNLNKIIKIQQHPHQQFLCILAFAFV